MMAARGDAAKQPYPSFWPAGRTLQVHGFDYWRVWLTRSEVRQTPTSPHNLMDRHAVLRMWIEELLRQKMPVNDVVPPQRMAQATRMMRSGETAEACREVDSIYGGLEGMMAGREYAEGSGSIVGIVVDEAGAPAAGANVMVFGSPLGAISDEEGRFAIKNAPCASPRYILRAQKPGYLDGYAGNISVTPDRAGEAIVLIEKVTPANGYRADNLSVRIGRVVEIKQTANPTVPLDTAVLDMKNYPEAVGPYLKPSANIDSDSPAVREKAKDILASVPETDRLRSTVIAKAVYGWIVRNIEYDVMRNYPDDPTGGNWQTTYGGWGRNFDDWCYKPSEVLEQRRAICIEYERLAAALLRALHIPARPAPLGAHPVCQWWVQLPTGNGYWANMETSIGRNEYKRTGSLDAKFPSVGDDRIAFYGIDERAPIHMAWNAARPCLWLEDYGERLAAGRSERGLRAAHRLLDQFSEHGRVPKGAREQAVPRARRAMPCYQITSRGFVLNLASLGAQKNLTARFPMFVSNQYRETVTAKHWTNHPEWVKDVRRENERNGVTKEGLEWYCIDFELGAGAVMAAEEGTAGGSE